MHGDQALVYALAGACGGGVDACAATAGSTIELFAYLFGPPILFAAVGFYLFSRRRPVQQKSPRMRAFLLQH
ncbi:hypothetical protein MK974_22040 [Burkholderia ambifaria]|uniref:hypothetical protein n=1 Tax=Burkholderia ambifaria TaxID=152480 RepID=UPI0022A97BED|nr:hypothetical protein [Burkholderia ambifaria]WAS55796.1 hypothetical protein MK974_22040 [Burkholderia ambifaria]